MKALLISALLFLSLHAFGQDRKIEIHHNDNQIVYAVDDVYYYGEEKQPLTAEVAVIGRWSEKVEQLSIYKDGQLISKSEYDNGVIRYKAEYAEGKIVRKSYYEKGELVRTREY